jgi:hypothetical protein
MKHITTTQKILTGTILLLVSFIVGYVYFFKHITALNTELHEVNKELATLDILEENKQSTITLLADTEADREELQKHFVPTEDPTPFLESIENIARITNVELEVDALRVEAPSGAVSMESQKEIRTTLSVSGTWDNLFWLLALLETMPYTSTITNTTISLKEGTGLTKWGGQIQLRSIAL